MKNWELTGRCATIPINGSCDGGKKRAYICALASFYNEERGYSFPTKEQLSERSNVREQSLKDAYEYWLGRGVVLAKPWEKNPRKFCYHFDIDLVIKLSEGIESVGNTSVGNVSVGNTSVSCDSNTSVPNEGNTSVPLKEDIKEEIKKEEESVALAPSLDLFPSEMTPEEKPKKEPKPKKAKAELDFRGLPDELIEEWKAYRSKEKKAPLTQRAINRFAVEAGRAGISLAEAVRFSMYMEWQGFQAAWYEKEKRTVHQNIFSSQPSYYVADPQPEPKQEVAEEPNPFAKEGAAMIEKQIADHKKEIQLIYDDDYDPEVLKEIDRRLKGKQIKRLA